MPRTDKYPFRSDLRARLVDVATQGQTVSYLDLGAGRAMIGRYLYRIAKEEAAGKRPPLTSVVVRKGSGMPGEGFMEAMAMIDYVTPTDNNDEQKVWERALRETHEYWRPRLHDDLT